MHHQSQKVFRGIFVGLYNIKKGYLVYVLSKCKIVSSYDVVFDFFSSALEYTSRLYSETLSMKPSVLYISYTTLSHERSFNIINFAQFEEGNLVENERNSE